MQCDHRWIGRIQEAAHQPLTSLGRDNPSAKNGQRWDFPGTTGACCSKLALILYGLELGPVETNSGATSLLASYGKWLLFTLVKQVFVEGY